MKKILLFFACLLPFSVSASLTVSDGDTGRILYNINGNERKLIASTTKFLTALVVINNADLDEVIEVNQSVLKSFGSGIYVSIGEKISIRDLLYGLLLRSGNDAAIVLAEHVGGSEQGFALMMNELAKSIGMYSSHFINASGLENENKEGNMSTSNDMTRLMSYAIKNKTFMEISGTYHHEVQTNMKFYDWYNKNKLLKTYKYTTAGKTGFTVKARRTLVTSASKDGKNLVICTLNEDDDFDIHKVLYEQYFSKYKLINVIDKNDFMKDDGFYVKENFDILVLDNELSKIKVNVTYTDDALKRAGFVTVTFDDQEYFRTDLYKIEKKEKKSFWSKIKELFTRLFK